MSEKVVNILEKQPHRTGNAVCLHCKHEWQAVAPTGVTILKCPECKLEQGAFKCLSMPGDDDFWECGVW